LAGHRVVTQVGAAVAAGQKHSLAGADILVVSGVASVAEVTSGGDGDVVTRDHAAGLQRCCSYARDADGSGGAAVVSLVSGGDAADGKGFTANAGGCRGLVGHGVVA
jgi:hypothetical protein